MTITQGGGGQKMFGWKYRWGGSILKMSKVWRVILLKGRHPEKFSSPPPLQIHVNNDRSLTTLELRPASYMFDRQFSKEIYKINTPEIFENMIK